MNKNQRTPQKILSQIGSWITNILATLLALLWSVPVIWALVASVPATQSDEYLAEVTTVADSTATGTAWSTFLLTTHTTTPSVWFVCQPESGYSVDNLAPTVPAEFAVAYDSEGNLLTWSPSDAPDFDHFQVYRGLEPDFIP